MRRRDGNKIACYGIKALVRIRLVFERPRRDRVIPIFPGRSRDGHFYKTIKTFN